MGDNFYIDQYVGKSSISLSNCTFTFKPDTLRRGDRVRIKEGYESAGRVGFFIGKSTYHAHQHMVAFEDDPDYPEATLDEAIEPYPYTREERIEQAIEDYVAKLAEIQPHIDIAITDDDRARLYAIFDAGV